MSGDELPDDRRARALWVAEVADDPARTEARFDAYAADYEVDSADMAGWCAPSVAASVAVCHLPKDAHLLDAGAGTGLVGEALARHGYRNLVALDLSRRMLDVARAKNVYRELHKGDLNEPLGFPDGSFDGLLSIGTSGYMTGEAIGEFARIVRPGGSLILLFGDQRYEEGGFRAAVTEGQAERRLELVEVTQAFAPVPRCQPEHQSRLYVLRVLG